MQRKEKLNEYRSLLNEVQELKKLIAELEAKCEGTRVIISDMPRGGVPADNFVKLGDAVRKLKELEEQINTEIDDITAFILCIEDSITRQIFVQRYIKNKPWDKVGKAVNFSERQVRRKHEEFWEKY